MKLLLNFKFSGDPRFLVGGGAVHGEGQPYGRSGTNHEFCRICPKKFIKEIYESTYKKLLYEDPLL